MYCFIIHSYCIKDNFHSKLDGQERFLNLQKGSPSIFLLFVFQVSPVYGRRLSTSAKGLLDCLAQLQLIDPPSGPDAGPDADKDRKHRYTELMDILQSLWLTDPREGRDRGKDPVTPTTSSSGLDSGLGSGGSRGSGNGGVETTEKGEIPEERVTTIIEEGEGEMDEGAGKAEEGEGEAEGGEGEAEGGEGEAEGGESTELPADQATPDPEQSNPGEDASTPDEQATPDPLQEHGQVLKTPESPKATETPSSDELSSAYKSPTDTERDTSSGTPPSVVVRAPPTKRFSLDPDPTWVLNLLKKLEKQFMCHYTDAMVDFKVRWDLDDNVLLDAMITELRDEVSKRIQSSIERELRKIQGRAGRGGKSPRPPQAGQLSRESTITDQRRRRLKVRGFYHHYLMKVV